MKSVNLFQDILVVLDLSLYQYFILYLSINYIKYWSLLTNKTIYYKLNITLTKSYC